MTNGLKLTPTYLSTQFYNLMEHDFKYLDKKSANEYDFSILIPFYFDSILERKNINLDKSKTNKTLPVHTVVTDYSYLIDKCKIRDYSILDKISETMSTDYPILALSGEGFNPELSCYINNILSIKASFMTYSKSSKQACCLDYATTLLSITSNCESFKHLDLFIVVNFALLFCLIDEFEDTSLQSLLMEKFKDYPEAEDIVLVTLDILRNGFIFSTKYEDFYLNYFKRVFADKYDSFVKRLIKLVSSSNSVIYKLSYNLFHSQIETATVNDSVTELTNTLDSKESRIAKLEKQLQRVNFKLDNERTLTNSQKEEITSLKRQVIQPQPQPQPQLVQSDTCSDMKNKIKELENTVAKLENRNASLENKLLQKDKEIELKEEELDSRQLEIDSLEEQLNLLEELLQEEDTEMEIPPVTQQVLNLLNSRRVLVVGGYPKFKTRLQKYMPDATMYSITEMSPNLDVPQCDYCLVYTKAITHTMTNYLKSKLNNTTLFVPFTSYNIDKICGEVYRFVG